MTQDHRTPRPKRVGRRRMLLRLGLAATAAYAAPVLTRLGSARAQPGTSLSLSTSLTFSRPGAATRAAAPEIVVMARDPGTIERLVAAGFSLLARDRVGLTAADLARFSLPPGLTLEAARDRVRALAPDALSDANHVYVPGELACGDDGCEAFGMIGWPGPAQPCPTAPVIGLIDTGVNLDHAALADVAIEAIRVAGAERPASGTVHGTAIAILIAGRGDTRTPGLLDGVRLVAADAFHRTARGQDIADSFDVARAIDTLAAREVGVVNLSFTGPRNDVLQEIVHAARDRGIVLVAAAGNEGPGAEPLYPAAFAEVLAVTAVDHRQEVYRQANRGAHIAFAAPGVQLWTAASVSGGRFRSGTSYAAPFVTAAFAAARVRHPEATVDELIDRVAAAAADLGAPGHDPVFGHGLVQSDGACRPAEKIAGRRE